MVELRGHVLERASAVGLDQILQLLAGEALLGSRIDTLDGPCEAEGFFIQDAIDLFGRFALAWLNPQALELRDEPAPFAQALDDSIGGDVGEALDGGDLAGGQRQELIEGDNAFVDEHAGALA